MKTEPIYLDHNASTPTAPEVIEVMVEAMRTHHANPSSIEHGPGAAAQRIIENAREDIAKTIGCLAKEVIFTSGSTEANALAIRGAYPKLQSQGRPHLVTSAIEHPSVMENMRALEADGAPLTVLPAGENGIVDLDAARDAITPETGLVSIMTANNETGVLQPVDEIGAMCDSAGALFHTDYSQATAFIAPQLSERPIHLASFSGHKAYGPKGMGALFVSSRKPRVRLTPIIAGGGQERGMRSGTLNTPGIVGLATAFQLVREKRDNDAQQLSALRDKLKKAMLEIPGARLNGHETLRLPNTLSFSIDEVEPLALMHVLRDKIVFSASSACATDKVETSPVLKAMFGDSARAREGFRLGLGRNTSNKITDTSEAFKHAVAELRPQHAISRKNSAA